MLFLEIYIVCGILSGIITYFTNWVLYKAGELTEEQYKAVPLASTAMMVLGVFSFAYIVWAFIDAMMSDYEE